MPPLRVKKHNNPEEKAQFGPSWYDVYIIMRELRARFPDNPLTVSLHINTGIDRSAGLLVWVRDGMGTIWGAQRFMDRDPSSSKTAAAAFWTACTKAYHALEEEQARMTQQELQLDITDDEVGPPFDPPEIGY